MELRLIGSHGHSVYPGSFSFSFGSLISLIYVAVNEGAGLEQNGKRERERDGEKREKELER